MNKEKKEVQDKKAPRRAYTRPKVLSAEGLEAAAATCDPPVDPYGKTFVADPLTCTSLGS